MFEYSSTEDLLDRKASEAHATLCRYQPCLIRRLVDSVSAREGFVVFVVGGVCFVFNFKLIVRLGE